MSNDLSQADARAALATVEQSRQRVIDEIDMPRWYWWGLALGWIALGVITDLGNALATLVATFAFGAVHAAVFGRLSAGRSRSERVRVSSGTAGWYAPAIVIGSLLVLAAVTVGVALIADAAGSGYPVTIASIVVAVLLLLGGPRLMVVVRRLAARPRHAG